jgi:hypothetical protein
MGRQRAAVRLSLSGRGDALGWIGLLLVSGVGGGFPLEVVQTQFQLVERQGLGPAAEALTLHYLRIWVSRSARAGSASTIALGMAA